jgi:general secretion pathway protein G
MYKGLILEILNNNKGFSLIEMLVVMVLMGLLASLVGPKLFSKVDKAKINTAKAQIEMASTALDAYRLDIGRFPKNVSELRRSDNKNWDGPYLPKDIPLDPWGTPYVYVYPGKHGPYDLYSYGQDGKEGQVNGNENKKVIDLVVVMISHGLEKQKGKRQSTHKNQDAETVKKKIGPPGKKQVKDEKYS